MMIGILDSNEPHKLPMKLFFFLFYAKEEKINEQRYSKKIKAKSKEMKRTKQNRMTEESLKLIYTFVLRHHCAHQKFTLSYIKTRHECLLHSAISTSASNRDSIYSYIFVAHVSLSTAASRKLSNC